MGDLTALNTALAQLTTDVDTALTALENAGPSDQPEIDAATAAITTLDQQVQAVINPAPAPAPTPAPSTFKPFGKRGK